MAPDTATFAPSRLRQVLLPLLAPLPLARKLLGGVRVRYRARVRLAGWTAIILSFLIGGIAYNTGNNLVFLMLSGVLALITVSGILSRLNAGRFETALRLPAHVTEGEPFFAEVAVTNTGRRGDLCSLSFSLALAPASQAPAPGLALNAAWDTAPDAQIPVTLIPPGGTLVRHVRLTAPRRGLFTVLLPAMTTSYPFGFIEKSMALDTRRNILVLPSAATPSAPPHTPRNPGGHQTLNQRGEGVDLLSIRPYREGDPLRNVHWKLTAKTGRHLVREFAREQLPRLTIVLDHSALTEANLPGFEDAIRLAAGLAAGFQKNGFAVGLWTPRSLISCGSSPSTLLTIRRELALLPDSPTPSPVHHRQMPSSSPLSGQLLFIEWERRAPAGMSPVSPHTAATEVRP